MSNERERSRNGTETNKIGTGASLRSFSPANRTELRSEPVPAKFGLIITKHTRQSDTILRVIAYTCQRIPPEIAVKRLCWWRKAAGIWAAEGGRVVDSEEGGGRGLATSAARGRRVERFRGLSIGMTHELQTDPFWLFDQSVGEGQQCDWM